jgi:hypothetical protein
MLINNFNIIHVNRSHKLCTKCEEVISRDLIANFSSCHRPESEFKICPYTPAAQSYKGVLSKILQ